MTGGVSVLSWRARRCTVIAIPWLFGRRRQAEQRPVLQGRIFGRRLRLQADHQRVLVLGGPADHLPRKL